MSRGTKHDPFSASRCHYLVHGIVLTGTTTRSWKVCQKPSLTSSSRAAANRHLMPAA